MAISYRIEIWKEEKNGHRSFGWRSEKAIFQIILNEEEVDIKGVMQKIVGGREKPNVRSTTDPGLHD